MAEKETQNQETDVQKKRVTILLVDDMPMIISMIRRQISVINGKNYDIHSANSGNDAIKKIDELGGFDALLSDLQMPNGSGKKLYNYIAEKFPHLEAHVGFFTGDPGQYNGFARTMIAQERLINKPFTTTQLRNLLETVLEGKSPIKS